MISLFLAKTFVSEIEFIEKIVRPMDLSCNEADEGAAAEDDE